MEEYIKLVTEISGKLWKEFKPRITADMTQADFWEEVRKVYSGIVDEYKGTDAEGYAIDMAIFYILQFQRITKKDFKEGRWGKFWDALEELKKK